MLGHNGGVFWKSGPGSPWSLFHATPASHLPTPSTLTTVASILGDCPWGAEGREKENILISVSKQILETRGKSHHLRADFLSPWNLRFWGWNRKRCSPKCRKQEVQEHTSSAQCESRSGRSTGPSEKEGLRRGRQQTINCFLGGNMNWLNLS